MHQANVITDNKVTTEGPGTRGKYYISLLFLHSWLCPPLIAVTDSDFLGLKAPQSLSLGTYYKGQKTGAQSLDTQCMEE